MAKNQRVVITGIGTVLPNAFDLESFWSHLRDDIARPDDSRTVGITMISVSNPRSRESRFITATC